MNRLRTIPTPEPADVVTFTILIDGTELPGELGIMGLYLSKEVNRIPYLRLLVRDGDASVEDFPASNEDYFVPGNQIEVKLGYRSDESTVFRGVITNQSIKVTAGKAARLEIECKDESYKMTINRKSRFFEDVKDHEVFSQLIDNHNLIGDFEATSYMHPKLVQYNATDWDFMVTRAEACGQLVFVDDGRIRTALPDLSAESTLALTYGANIIELEAGLNGGRQYADLRSFSWSAAEQELSEAETGDPGIEEAGNLSGSELSAVHNEGTINYCHSGQRPEDELLSWADSGMLRNRLSKIRGRVTCQGFAGIKPGDTIDLAGAGDRFSGKHFVSSVSHELTAGNWITHIQFGLTDQWFTQSQKIELPKASGLIPPVSGLMTGTATQLESDPEGAYRVLVKLPVIDPDDEGIWARIALLDAGNERGSYFRPEPGDEVVVGFLNDDPRDPVILGMLHSSAIPAPYEPTDQNHIKGFVSRSGMKLTFDDDSNRITLETPTGNKLELSEAEGGIIIQDENDHKIEMNSSGITLESQADLNIKASGDITIEGMNINLNASSEFKAEGMAGAEVSTGAILRIQGSLVQIN